MSINVIAEDRASGAQVVNGSLKFDASKSQYLTRTPTSAGNRKTWTWSGWLKRASSSASNKHPFYGAYGGSSATSTMLAYDNSTDDVIRFEDDFINGDLAGKTPAVFRDFGGGWYHVVISLDTTQSSVTYGLKIYVNGTQQTGLTGTIWNQNHDSNINSTVAQYLGSDTTAANRFFDGAMSQVTFIDGQALGPSYFGFTDPLTGTWRPKRLQEGDQAVKNRQLLYNVNTSDNGFDSSSTSRTYDAASRTFSTYTTPQTANPGGQGANSAHVYKSPTGSAITWVVSTDTTDRYIWTSEDGVNWTSKGSYYDTDSSPQSVTSTYIALAAGSNGSNVTVTSTIVNFGTNGFYLPMDGSAPIGHDLSKPNPVNNGTIWSSNGGGNLADVSSWKNAFNGVIPANNSSYSDVVACEGGQTSTVTFSPAISGNIRVFISSSASSGTINGSVSLSDSSSVSANVYPNAATFKDFGSKSNITSLTLNAGSNGGVRLSAIEVDGVVLTDDMYGNGWTPVNFGGSVSLDNPIASGALPILNTDGSGNVARVGVRPAAEGFPNAGANDGTVWSDSLTGARTDGTNGKTDAFDGSLTTKAGTSGNGGTLTFTPASAISYNSSVEVYTYWGSANNVNVSLNGGASVTDPGNQWTTIATGSGSITSMTFTGTTNSGEVSAIRVDGVILLDGLGLVLALPLVGGSGTDVSNLINSGSTTKAVTVTSATSSSLSNFYNSSMNFDGSNDKLDVADSSDFHVDTGDWCAECWFYTPASDGTSKTVFSNYSADAGQFTLGINSLQLFGYLGSTQIIFASATTAIAAGEWVHLVLNHDDSSSTTTLYINGISKATSTTAVPASNRNGFFLGHNTAHSSRWISANYQDVRFYKGTAKYTSDFVVPSTSPDILPDTPSGVSGGSKLTKIIDGAVHFDGSGDYLLGGTSSDYNFGTGDFTIEGYIYPTNNSGTQGIMGIGNAVSPACQIFYNVSNSQTVRFNVTDGNAIQSTVTSPVNKWSHFAVVREGTSITNTKLYINGKLGAQGYFSTNLTETTLQIGRPNTSSGTEYFNGFISNFRVIKGTALYTSDFTPPTRTLTNVTNTKLLCCQSNTEPGGASVAPNISGINDGTQWSSFGNSFWDTSNPLINGFDGSTTTIARPANDTNDPRAIWEISDGIPFTTSLKLRAAMDASSSIAKIEVNDVDVTSQFTAGTSTLATVTLTGVTSPLRKIALRVEGGRAQPRFSAVYVDDVIVVDPLTPNGDAAATNFNPFNTDINTVRGQESGYATLNPLYPNPNGNSPTDGNLKQTTTSGNGQYNATMAIPQTGSWYWEVTKEGTNSTGIIGISNPVLSMPSHNVNNVGAFSWYIAGPRKQTNGVDSNYGGSVAQGDVIGVAYNSNIRELRFYLNGVDQGVAFDASSIGIAEYFPAFSAGSSSNTFSFSVNFGQKPFKFPPPDGFQSLNLASIRPETVITRPDQYVSTVLWTGNGGTQIINAGLKPDFVWIKNRDDSDAHFLLDTVRGATKRIRSDSDTTQTTRSNSLTQFNSDGFEIGSDNAVNSNNDDIVAWCWRAGGNKNTFNVDDVGYSSAGDVGFDVGGQNNNAYDRSQTWSSYMSNSSGAGNLFDGVLTNYYGPDGNPQTFIPTSAITVNTSLEVYYSSGSTSRNFEINDNGNVVATGTGTKWVNLNFTGSLTKIYGTNGWNVSAIRIDGKILVDNGVTPPNVPSIAATGASVGTKQGFSIIKYTGNGSTGQTIPHGLTQNVDFVMIKNLGSTKDWVVYHKSFNPPDGTEEKALYLNEKTNSAYDKWRVDLFSPPSIGFDSQGNNNYSGDNHIAYCWHDVPGLQKFGKYIGNSDADGPFIELGFRPSIILIRCTTNSEHWAIWDTKRSTFNTADDILRPNTNAQELANYSSGEVDFLSNGFKLRGNWGATNSSSQTYIYAAWAEAPSINLYGGQSNAR